jgi:hypothetical protein
VDRVACTYNAKLPRFNSRFYQIGTEAVDAFTQNWGFNNNWLFPPNVLIPRVIRHLCECLADGTLLVPIWKSAVFWTMLCEDGVHWNNWIHEWKALSNERNLIIKGKAKNCIFIKSPLSFQDSSIIKNFVLVCHAYN